MRAAHQLLDIPQVFADPLALAILGADGQEQLRAHLPAHRDPASQSIRATLAARSRFAEDQWKQAAARGVRQYVILGAGLDTFAYRSEATPGVRVFEVDHPATQAWKRKRLADAGIGEPAFLAYVPTDFESTHLQLALAAGGFRAGEPAFFSWLGVAVYLETEAVWRTLRFIAACAKGSAVVFDYVVDPALLPAPERAGVQAVAARVAQHGEPWKTYFSPTELEQGLREAGFSEVRTLDGAQINPLLFAGRTDGLRMGRSSRIVHALV